jgi:hypothetical protein
MPAMALITEFTYSADGGSMTSVRFGGDSTTLSGDQFVYPTGGSYPVMSNVTENNWHISGNIGDYSGFGLSFDNCSRVNASAYRGISFTISGTVAMGSMITMGSATLNNRIAASWLIAHPVAGSTPTAADPGRCIPNAAAVNQYAQSDCVDATKVIQVTTSPVTQNILWTDFTGGKPEANVTPTDITTVYWFFPPPVGAGSTNPTPYMADIRIDDLKFIQ